MADFSRSPPAEVGRRRGHPEIDVSDVSRFGDLRQARTVDRNLCTAGFQAKRVVVIGVRARPAQRMTLRETHGTARGFGAGARAHQFGQLDRPLYAFRSAHASHRDPGILRGQQTLRDLAGRA